MKASPKKAKKLASFGNSLCANQGTGKAATTEVPRFKPLEMPKRKRLTVNITLTPQQNALLDALVTRRERERQPTERPLTRAEVALLCLTVGIEHLTSKETDIALQPNTERAT